MPYSGTRSLMDHLDIDHYEHFGGSVDYIKHGDFLGHVPLRNPMDVAASWAFRGRSIDDLVNSYELMFDYINNRDHRLYVMERLPVTRGVGEYVMKCDQRATAFRAAVVECVVKPHRAFFEKHY